MTGRANTCCFVNVDCHMLMINLHNLCILRARLCLQSTNSYFIWPRKSSFRWYGFFKVSPGKGKMRTSCIVCVKEQTFMRSWLHKGFWPDINSSALYLKRFNTSALQAVVRSVIHLLMHVTNGLRERAADGNKPTAEHVPYASSQANNHLR